MKILVTGACGMIGSHMIEILYNNGHEVLGTYYKPTINLKEVNTAIKLVECDVRYFQIVQRIIMDFQPEQIFHLAAQSYPTISWDNPQATIDINVNGTINVFESVKFVREVRKDYDPVIVVACSSAEYGYTLEKIECSKVKENVELKPLHPYGVSKVAQDLLSFQYFMNDGIKSIRARIFNTTGNRKVNDVTSDFTMRAIEQEKAGIENPILRVGNIETFRAIMDFKDLINALMLLAKKGKYGDVYNISSEHVYQVKDIILIIEELIGKKFKLEIDPKLLRSTDEKIIVGDITKLKNDTGWKQVVDLKTTLLEMLNYWRKNL